jgi:hypothetical protein
MARTGAALAASLAAILVSTAACTEVRAADPFPEVREVAPAPPSHRWAYVSMLVGAGLIGGSFLVSNRADDTYRDYLAATDPRTIETLYDRAVLQDRIASTTLLGGEALIAVGIYLRFIRHPVSSRADLMVTPTSCALSFRF